MPAVAPPNQYTEGDPGEVRDNYTGLIWQRADSADLLSHADRWRNWESVQIVDRPLTSRRLGRPQPNEGGITAADVDNGDPPFAPPPPSDGSDSIEQESQENREEPVTRRSMSRLQKTRS